MYGLYGNPDNGKLEHVPGHVLLRKRKKCVDIKVPAHENYQMFQSSRKTKMFV